MSRGGSVYPAVQNLLLDARGLGLGSVITSPHKRCEDEVKALLGIPVLEQRRQGGNLSRIAIRFLGQIAKHLGEPRGISKLNP